MNSYLVKKGRGLRKSALASLTAIMLSTALSGLGVPPLFIPTAMAAGEHVITMQQADFHFLHAAQFAWVSEIYDFAEWLRTAWLVWSSVPSIGQKKRCKKRLRFARAGERSNRLIFYCRQLTRRQRIVRVCCIFVSS